MNVSDFDYDLPPHLIAQTPAPARDAARLMHLDRQTGLLRHLVFRDLPELLLPGDALIINNTRVIRARLLARKAETGGKAELLLLRQCDQRHWQALIGGRKIGAGARLLLDKADLGCSVLRRYERGRALIAFDRAIDDLLDQLGETPLPPYIRQNPPDPERYQTVYSTAPGSAAAPTAGLHFTPKLLRTIQNRGVSIARCTLHIGLDTFQPVTVERVADHKIHSEYIELDALAAAAINSAKKAGGRIIAVGTTSARVLESAAKSASACPQPGRLVAPISGDTDLFITPGYQWRAVDAMITNFHLPRSTLLMMLSALAGRERLLDAYETAKREGYRFYSFGDAMFIS